MALQRMGYWTALSKFFRITLSLSLRVLTALPHACRTSRTATANDNHNENSATDSEAN